MAKPIKNPEKLDLDRKWIFWRWENSDSKTLLYSQVQLFLPDLEILELRDSSFYTGYPDRINIEEIEIFRIKT